MATSSISEASREWLARQVAEAARVPAPPRPDTAPALQAQQVTPAGPGLLRCALHGVFALRTLFGRHDAECPHCRRDRNENRTTEEAAKLAAALHSRRLDECGLVGRYRSATFNTFDAQTPAQHAVRKACREFVETAGDESAKTLMLLGNVGTGKTHLCSAMARHLRLERNVWAKVTTPRAIVRALRDTWARDSERKESAVLAELVDEVEVLFLDEAGLGFGSDAELLQLFEVIDARYARGRPTVTASNLTAKQMRAALGDRVFDRLREGATVLVLDWPSHRGIA